MVEREHILSERQKLMTDSSAKQEIVATLQSEIKEIESRINNLQKLRSDLVTRQIEM